MEKFQFQFFSLMRDYMMWNKRKVSLLLNAQATVGTKGTASIQHVKRLMQVRQHNCLSDGVIRLIISIWTTLNISSVSPKVANRECVWLFLLLFWQLMQDFVNWLISFRMFVPINLEAIVLLCLTLQDELNCGYFLWKLQEQMDGFLKLK